MANPPFNVNNVDKEAIKDDPRFSFGIPNVDNANYLWIQIFNSMLNEKGRAGFVMANSASDAGSSELEIRKKIIEKGQLDIVISVAPRFFYTVSLAVTLWFLNKGKTETNKRKILFIDAREIYQKIDRAHVEFTPQQIEFISNIVRMYRGQQMANDHCSLPLVKQYFPNLKYQDVEGLCKSSTIEEMKEQNYSLTAGRYVSVKNRLLDFSHVNETIKKNHDDLRELNGRSRELEDTIDSVLSKFEES